jgi:hypothetical protein
VNQWVNFNERGWVSSHERYRATRRDKIENRGERDAEREQRDENPGSFDKVQQIDFRKRD